MQTTWYDKNISDAVRELNSNEYGLTEEEALGRLRDVGPNKLPEAKTDSLGTIFLRQFKSPLIYVLLIASIAVFLMGEIGDGVIILVVLIFNAIIGTFQEGKAQNTLLALKEFIETKGVVVREGKELIIPDEEIVPGDIIILQEGQKVPADARIISSHGITVDEAALTGESVPVHKVADMLNNDLKNISPIDQKNMVFKGTHVVAGNGRAVVVATGSETVIGQISKEVSMVDAEIPLKANIRHLSHLIIAVVVGMITILFLVGVGLGKSAEEMFMVGVSLAISMIPEGLPIVITLVLAQGVWRMGKRRALVKRLQAVGSLGQVQIVAADKTGTLTKNEMMVQKLYVNGKFFEIEGVGYEPKGDIVVRADSASLPQIISPPDFQELILAGRIASFCSNARIAQYENNTSLAQTENSNETQKQWHVSGDPTEAALLILAEKIGFKKDELLAQHPVLEEIPFDYKTKYHAVINSVENSPFLSVVGAPETVLNLSSTIWHYRADSKLSGASKLIPLTSNRRSELENVFIKMSEEGLRVLACAFRYPFSDHIPKDDSLKNKNPKSGHVANLVFIGFIGIRDTLRPEVEESVRRAKAAGVRVVMITGDHKITARAIAAEAGIFSPGDEVVIGEELNRFSEQELLDILPKVSVFARVTPEHKLKIIQAYQRAGKIIAMTGDGVNDAPSLVASDIGVAMGKIGTEVAKEASDVVLLNDNFGSIISAIEEGRSIFRTIKKVLLYLFSTNIGEMLTIAGALVLGYPLPILAAQIIWLNLVTDGFLDVALALEPKEKDLLAGKFEKTNKYLIDGIMLQRIIIMAIPMMIGTLYIFSKYFSADLQKAWTISLVCLAMFQWWNAWNCRSANESIFKMNPFSNRYLILAIFIVVLLQILAVYNPVMQQILNTKPLELREWFILLPIAFSVVVVEEIRKLLYRWGMKTDTRK